MADCGFQPIRLDKAHFNDKISARIIADIRRSQFVIADVTLERPNVYYEAGFAQALGKVVIWTCREGTDIHFDTSQYQHLVWNDVADLRAKLTDRLRALIPNANPQSS